MTDEEFESFDEVHTELAEQLREALAEDLGGVPEDYRPPTVTDGGDDGDGRE